MDIMQALSGCISKEKLASNGQFGKQDIEDFVLSLEVVLQQKNRACGLRWKSYWFLNKVQISGAFSN